MGLDMYLTGKKFIWTDEKKPLPEDGFEVKGTELRLGYWRKHPNLHGYIVETFAGGEDECQEIELTSENLQQIIDATKMSLLPETEGFFFGKSDPSRDPETIKILEHAKAWLNTNDDKTMRTVIYRASW